MAGPVLLASFQVLSAGTDNTTLVTPSFTPVAGDVLAIKGCTWDSANGLGTPTGGGQTYQSAVIAAPGGFTCWAGMYVCTITGSPGPMTVSWPPGTAGNTKHSMVVERWGSAKLAVTPAVPGVTHGLGTFSTSLTTVGANSVITWCMGEENSIDPATRTYQTDGATAGTEDGLFDGHVGSNSVHYFAYTPVLAAAGAHTFGLSAPTGLNWTTAAVEIQFNAPVGSEPGGWGTVYL